MKRFACAGSLLFASFASATAFGPAGTWSGAIEYTNDEGDSGTYDVNVTIDIQDDQLTLSEDFFGESTLFTVTGDQLYFDGSPVGALTDGGLSVSYPYPSDNTCKQTYSLDANGAYVDDLHCSDGYYDHVEGTLSQGKASAAVHARAHKRSRSN